MTEREAAVPGEVEWRAPERELDVAGLRINVRVVGEGPPVLLINGIGAHAGTWSVVEEALPGFRLIGYDAPGTGRSPMPRLPLSVPRLARLAAEVLDRVGVERADVLGYSLGGIVAQQFAAQSPHRVRRLLLVATTPGWGGVTADLGVMLNLMLPVRFWSRRLYQEWLGGLVGGRARYDRAWVEGLGEWRTQHAPSTHGYLGQLVGIGTWSTLPVLGRIPHPTLVVAGGDDPLSPLANGVLLAARLPRARLLLAPGEGHLLLWDEETTVLAGIDEFLRADPLEAARVWQEARVVSECEAREAIAASTSQAEPWATLGGVVRRVFSAPA